MFNDTSSPLALLHTRRSGKPRDMVASGPDADQLRDILSAAIRVPDHGKLAPWRFVIVRADQRAALEKVITDAYQTDKPDAGRLEMFAVSRSSKTTVYMAKPRPYPPNASGASSEPQLPAT